MSKYKIYKITNILNNKCYIGQTSESLKKRFNRHMGYQSQEHDTKFYRAVKKYGKECFIIDLIDDTAKNQEELDEKEVYWINYFDSVKNGYNSNNHKGKVGGNTLSNHENLEEIRHKISDSKKGAKNPRARKIEAVDIINNKKYFFDCMEDCRLFFGFSNHICISKRCRKIIKKPYKNRYLFNYV